MTEMLRVGFLGAGYVNFGGGTVWDHASRLEKIDGIEIVAIADIDIPKVRQRCVRVRSCVHWTKYVCAYVCI